MNLGKLLGAGKSFFGGRGTVSYRENKRVYLPKFNGEKNPFLPKAAEPAPASVPPPPAVKRAGIRVVPAKPSPFAGWSERLNPFRAPAPVTVPVRKAVQTELSLDAVKVIHNDLADDDIEVVPARSRTASTATVLSPVRSNGLEFMSGREMTTA